MANSFLFLRELARQGDKAVAKVMIMLDEFSGYALAVPVLLRSLGIINHTTILCYRRINGKPTYKECPFN